MKRFKVQQTYLVFMLILSVFIIILPGCGGGGGGHWDEPPTDTTAPRVTLTVPLNGATGVAINRNITATFSEDMNGATITPQGTFTVTVTGGASVAGTVTYVGRIATFDPTSNLATDTPYTAKITIAAKDLAGNALAAEYTWSFRTALTSL